MGLLSFFKRSAANPPAPAAAPESVEQARARARHRLIGAAVLVLVGVIGFPLLFETQPRPIPVDLPIEIPKRDGAPPLAVPAPKPAPESAQAPAPAERSGDVIDESAAEAGREVTADPTVPAPRQETARAEPKPAAPTPPKPEPSRPEPPKPSPTDAARARALLEGRDSAKPAAAATDSRFIVQVGAYSETASARDMRLKVEKLGLKTYTQVIDTGSGKRVRVRVGPFASREEADRAAAKLKAAGLPSAVLTL